LTDIQELFTIERAFYTGDFAQVIGNDISGYKETNKTRAQVLVARAKIYTGKARDVIAEFSSTPNPSLAAVKAYGEYYSGIKSGLSNIEKLIDTNADDAHVQFLGGLVLVAEKRYPEALALVGKHEGSLECTSLLVQIYLVQNRIDLAVKLVEDAKKWAQDNVVFNLCEAWTNLRQGDDKSQGAFYIYEELSSGGVSSARSFLGQAISQYELGRIPEAEELLREALELEPENPEALANSITLAIISGKDYSDLESKLEQVQRDHPSLMDLQDKSDLFDKIVSKYQAQMS
jgi:coatomer protein complex subunit epsilon